MTIYIISDGNATEETENWSDIIEIAENWYSYLRDQSDFQGDVWGYYSGIPEGNVDELNAAISVFENDLAEEMGINVFHGHGNYSVSAACQAGFNLTVETNNEV